MVCKWVSYVLFEQTRLKNSLSGSLSVTGIGQGLSIYTVHLNMSVCARVLCKCVQPHIHAYVTNPD